MRKAFMSAQNIITTKPSPALLARWANQQDGWARAIVSDVLKNRVQASDIDVERYLGVLLCEKKLIVEPIESVPMIEEQQQDDDTLQALRIETLKIGDGVNALKPGAQIDFGNNLTVVFGENGSGKSGFVRVLKRAAGVRIAVRRTTAADPEPSTQSAPAEFLRAAGRVTLSHLVCSVERADDR
jgi:hypothetical protein